MGCNHRQLDRGIARLILPSKHTRLAASQTIWTAQNPPRSQTSPCFRWRLATKGKYWCLILVILEREKTKCFRVNAALHLISPPAAPHGLPRTPHFRRSPLFFPVTSSAAPDYVRGIMWREFSIKDIQSYRAESLLDDVDRLVTVRTPFVPYVYNVGNHLLKRPVIDFLQVALLVDHA